MKQPKKIPTGPWNIPWTLNYSVYERNLSFLELLGYLGYVPWVWNGICLATQSPQKVAKWIWRLETTSDENWDGFWILDLEEQLGSSRCLQWIMFYVGIQSPFVQGFKQKHSFEDVSQWESTGLTGNMMWFRDFLCSSCSINIHIIYIHIYMLVKCISYEFWNRHCFSSWHTPRDSLQPECLVDVIR